MGIPRGIADGWRDAEEGDNLLADSGLPGEVIKKMPAFSLLMASQKKGGFPGRYPPCLVHSGHFFNIPDPKVVIFSFRSFFPGNFSCDAHSILRGYVNLTKDVWRYVNDH